MDTGSFAKAVGFHVLKTPREVRIGPLQHCRCKGAVLRARAKGALRRRSHHLARQQAAAANRAPRFAAASETRVRQGPDLDGSGLRRDARRLRRVQVVTTLLLDPHAFLWWAGADKSLSRRARVAIADPASECFVS